MDYFIDNDNCLLKKVDYQLYVWSPAAKGWKEYYPETDPMTSCVAVDSTVADKIMADPDYGYGPVADVDFVGTKP
jgi:hypothetical protein